MSSNKQLTGEIITIGSELLLGLGVDTNSAWLSSFLATLGITVTRHTSVADNLNDIITAFQRAWSENDITLVTGGLGPTEDDLTRVAAARAFEVPLIFSTDVAQQLEKYFALRSYAMPENNLRQAYKPLGSISVDNPKGSAPGFYIEKQSGLMFFMPGVPSEAKAMTYNYLKKHLQAAYLGVDNVFKTVIIKIGGLGESQVDSILSDLFVNSSNPKLGILASMGEIKIVITSNAINEAMALKIMEPVILEIKRRLPNNLFAYEDITLAEAVSNLLKEKNITLSLGDNISQGLVLGQLAPYIDANCLGLSMNINGKQGKLWQDFKTAVEQEAKKESSYRLLAILKAEHSDAQQADAANQRNIKCKLQLNLEALGKTFKTEFQISGDLGFCRQRIASLTMFYLWQFLNSIEN